MVMTGNGGEDCLMRYCIVRWCSDSRMSFFFLVHSAIENIIFFMMRIRNFVTSKNFRSLFLMSN